MVNIAPGLYPLALGLKVNLHTGEGNGALQPRVLGNGRKFVHQRQAFLTINRPVDVIDIHVMQRCAHGVGVTQHLKAVRQRRVADGD